MVRIIDYKKAVNTAGKEFFLLILMGGVSFVKSTITGNFYAYPLNGKRCNGTIMSSQWHHIFNASRD